ncbi:MAG: WD40 repeat domain-containing protein [Anaerolineales bacterium]|nr:WD40 repeat domain-containing protein [Anaerolineales bacterium]
MKKHILLALGLLLSACASAPAGQANVEANQPSATGSQATAASPATAEASPTVESSPTAVPLPYSGPNPRLAIVRWDEESEVVFLDVIELGSEELVASIPVEGAWRMVLSPDGSMLFSSHSKGPGTVYDLDSGESRVIDLSGIIAEDADLVHAAWAPSQQWLSLGVLNPHSRDSLWLYSLQTDQLTYIDQFTRAYSANRIAPISWSADDTVSYIRDVDGVPRITYDSTTGQHTVWPMPNAQTRSDLIKHSGLTPDSYRCEICVLPQLGLVHDYISLQESPLQYYYQLYDFDKVELLAYVATFDTQREDWLEYSIEVLNLFPLQDRGDYLLFVEERSGLFSNGDYLQRYYAAWNPSGEMPFTVVEGEPANTLPDVIPMAVSPDGSSFVGLRLAGMDEYGGTFRVVSALVVDLATAEVLYEYPLPDAAYFYPPYIEGIHVVWPGK